MSSHVSSPLRRIAKAVFACSVLLILVMQAVAPFAASAQSPEESNIVIPPGPGTPVIITGNVYEEISKKFSFLYFSIDINYSCFFCDSS